MWSNILLPNTTGSEGGIVLQDEAYNNSCRITLEKCERYYAITCGVYGVFAHTAFADELHSQSLYDEMKRELQTFMDRDTTMEEELEFYENFYKKF